MSQEPHTARRPFGEKSDVTFWIGAGVGVALVVALGAAQWTTSASAPAKAAKPGPSQASEAAAVSPVPQALQAFAFLLAPRPSWIVAGEGITWQWTHGA